MANKPDKGNGDRLFSKHLILVLALLFALLVTELMIFIFINNSTEDGVTQKDIFALTFGAFGTWIGAGAAYFFGRENMRTATESMLKMQGRSPEEILASTTLHDMNPRPIPKKVKEDDPIGEILDWLEEDERRFFIVVVNAADKFQYAVHEEAFYRFINEEIQNRVKAEKKGEGPQKEEEKGFDVWNAKLREKQVKDVIKYVKGREDLKRLIKAAVKLKEDCTASVASDTMERENTYVAVVVDDKDCPIGYITTGNIRHQLVTSK